MPRCVKCVVVGDGCEGMKTELIDRFVMGEVPDYYCPSVRI